MKYKVSKYFNECYTCRNKSKSLIVKFDAAMAKFDIGVNNITMNCPGCGNIRSFRIDTWWGGTFGNSDVIYNDTAGKEKIKISQLENITNVLLKSKKETLRREMTDKEEKFKQAKTKHDGLTTVLKRLKEKKNG